MQGADLEKPPRQRRAAAHARGDRDAGYRRLQRQELNTAGALISRKAFQVLLGYSHVQGYPGEPSSRLFKHLLFF